MASAVVLLQVGFLSGCSDTLVDPRKPPTDAGLTDISTDSLWDLDAFNTCATNERLCTVEGPPCEPLDDAGLPPVGCGPQPQCIDVMSNNQRCGSCDTGCNTQTHQCESGQCVCKIEDADSCGSQTCIDLDTSRQHCGDCNRDCDDGQSCKDGECVSAPGDMYGFVNGASGYITDEFFGSGPHAPVTHQIAINNYARDETYQPVSGDPCTDADGPDVFFSPSFFDPLNGINTSYVGQLTVTVNRPGYAVAIWQNSPSGTPLKCVASEFGNASATITAGCYPSVLYSNSVMVRKIYDVPESNSPVAVTLTASAAPTCLP